jgi:alpha-beta hydrolase superfamily lysophospholipase
MLTRALSFFSDRIRLDGLLQLPDGLMPGERRPAIVLCSGFQGLKELIPAKLWGPLTEAGFVCFAFDYRGLGTSAGERGRIIPVEQVADVKATVTAVQQQPEVDRTRIGLVGWGFGGGIVVQAAAEDERVRAVVCLNGIGDAGRAVQGTRSAEDWRAVQEAIAADRIERARTGWSRLVSPWIVVPLDPHTRQNVDEDMYGNHPRFAQSPVTLQSAEAYYAFQPELAAERISPRPLLIVHGQRNALHSIEEARRLYGRAGEPKELIEIPSAHHLDWIQPSDPLYAEYVPRIVSWLQGNLL